MSPSIAGHTRQPDDKDVASAAPGGGARVEGVSVEGVGVEGVRAMLAFNRRWRRHFVTEMSPRFLPAYYHFETDHEPEELAVGT